MSAKILVFKITGEWAHFKRPYTTTSPLTFDLPAPPSVLGYIGAILGLDKREYLDRLNSFCRVSVSLLAQPKKFKVGIKLLDTEKSAGSFRGVKTKNKQLVLRPNPTVPIGVEILSNPEYLVFCQLDEPILSKELVCRLQNNQPHYTPCLGLAWCLSEFEYLGNFPATPEAPAGEIEITGWLPKALVKKPVIEAGKRYHMMTLPTRMLQTRQVTEFADMIYEFSGKTIRCELKNEAKLWQLQHHGALSEFGEQAYVYLV